MSNLFDSVKLTTCAVCGGMKGIVHQCPPAWEVTGEGIEDWDTVYVQTAEEAAAEYLRRVHQANGVYQDETVKVIVRKPGVAGTWKFEARAEISYDYTAYRVF